MPILELACDAGIKLNSHPTP